LFSLKGVQTHGQAFLLQILRRRERAEHVTDELTFTVVVCQSKLPSEGTQRGLLPGLNQVVIVLDEEGIPNSYGIDEAER
jgi:hypothetical protein